jgi:hypothetical protein
LATLFNSEIAIIGMYLKNNNTPVINIPSVPAKKPISIRVGEYDTQLDGK